MVDEWLVIIKSCRIYDAGLFIITTTIKYRKNPLCFIQTGPIS